MKFLLIKSIISISQCLCTIWLSIQTHQEVRGSFKRDEVPASNAYLTRAVSKSFKYKADLVGKSADNADRNNFVKNAKIAVSLKYLINFKWDH